MNHPPRLRMKVNGSKKPQIAVILLAILASLFAGSLVIAPAATAAQSFGFAHGYWVGHEYVGSINNEGHIAYCTQPNLRLTRSQSWTEVKSLTGVSALRAQEAAYVLDARGNTVDNDQAAAVRIAVNALVGDGAAVQRWERNLPTRITDLANRFINEAARLHGPYNVGLAVTKGASVGGPGILHVLVTSAARNPIPGAVVTLNATNASLPNAVRTTGNGTVNVAFTRTGIDLPVFTAQTALAPTAVLVGNAAPGEQKLKAAAPKQVYNARATYTDTLIKVAQNYACTTQCNGNPPVTSSACNPAAAVAQYIMFVDAKPVGSLTLNPGQCNAVTFNVADTKRLVSQLHYIVNGHPTRAITTNVLVIDCPPLPVISVKLVCDCTTALMEFSIPVNTTKHAEAIYINGASVATAAPGQSVTYPVTATRGKATTISFAPAIQRATGGWNVGGSLNISVP